MINNSAIVGLMVAVCVGVVLFGFMSASRTGCTAAHYGGRGAITVIELQVRLAAEIRSDSSAPLMDSWLSAWSHDAPDSLPTVAQAHDIMQLHRECRMEICDRKRAAYWALVSEGRIRPDSRVERAAER